MTPPSLAEAAHVFARIGLSSFGGPAAQIALMHRELVARTGWLSEQEFLSATSFCMMLPGPEAMQISTYAGWRLHGTPGGLLAGLLFVLPGAAVILSLALLYAYLGDVPLIKALFLGVKAAVLVIVIEALAKVARRALDGPLSWAFAGLAFAGLFFFDLPYPLIVLTAALAGFAFLSGPGSVPETAPLPKVTAGATLRTILFWLAIWWVPVGLVALSPAAPILTDISLFFSKLAVVTFGGAYAVLAYMGQDVVGAFGWLTAGEMMDGLGLAETTPGPLILVTEFVGFLAGFKAGGLGLAIAAALLTLWVTFVPCFLWIFAGAPYLAAISANARLSGALLGITAAVVGVILNLSIWFALNVFFAEVSRTHIGMIAIWTPEVSSFDFRVPVIAALAGALLLWRKWGLIRVLGISAGLGVVLSQI